MTAVAAPRRHSATAASAAPLRRTGESPSGARPRRHLRAVEESPRARARGLGLVRFLSLVVFVGLLSVVVFHVVMAQRGLALDDIRSQIDEEQTRYERLRLETAALSSPARIEAEATDRLGMVRPDRVEYLEAPLGATDAGAVGGTTSTLADADEWDAVKPHLDAQP